MAAGSAYGAVDFAVNRTDVLVCLRERGHDGLRTADGRAGLSHNELEFAEDQSIRISPLVPMCFWRLRWLLPGDRCGPGHSVSGLIQRSGPAPG
ncbi:hypothetical protein Veis_0961 [Verminephrobacter eiseniae EF01-2]|uniref:Uncharacterized protein n=1 Tax=Verminephrobacter eiseniae (strain EF01-2) TaxID=391735 RepID=A1WGI2_VEREI|nr:hypothetical protein Veis_0961 [Verminephrobacter eiseniae EF01-2]